MKRVFTVIIILALLAGIGYVGLRAYEKSQAKPQQRARGQGVVPVEIVLPERRTLHDTAMFTGSLEADSKFIVASQIGGQLNKLLVNIGDRIATSQPIAEIDEASYREQLAQAVAEEAVALAAVTEARSNREVAQSEYNRTKSLHQTQVKSDADLEQAASKLAVQNARCTLADAQVKQKEAARKQAEIRLSYTKIYASWQGGSASRRIGERFVNEGALLAANSPVVSVIDIGTLVAAVFVPERDYAKISTSQPTQITTDAYPGVTFPGYIERIAPQLQETSRQARVEVRVPNADERLRPGMFVRVNLEYAAHADAQTIPAAALAKRNNIQGVFVLDSSRTKARFVPCTLGISEKIPQGEQLPLDVIEVLSPKLDGPVVVMGQHLLEEDSTVRVVEPEKPTTRPPGKKG